jgi:hypothetical protein
MLSFSARLVPFFNDLLVEFVVLSVCAFIIITPFDSQLDADAFL